MMTIFLGNWLKYKESCVSFVMKWNKEKLRVWMLSEEIPRNWTFGCDYKNMYEKWNKCQILYVFPAKAYYHYYYQITFSAEMKLLQWTKADVFEQATEDLDYCRAKTFNCVAIGDRQCIYFISYSVFCSQHFYDIENQSKNHG